MTEPNRRPRIADFSTHWSGPLASHILTDLGADVVKVENPKIGDGNRGVAPLIEDVAMVHIALNAGTRSLAMDRHSPEWPDVVKALCQWADVVIVGAKPTDAVKRGIDFATTAAYNPSIVYCLISGFGLAGPWQDYSAHGQNIDALAGLVNVAWKDGLPITQAGWRSSGTTLAGMWAAIGILEALLRKQRGEAAAAQFVDISIWAAALSWQWRDLTTHANLGHPWNDYSELGSRYAMYPTSDDRALLLAPVEQKFWEQFCDLAGLPERKSIGDWSASGMYFGGGPEGAAERTLIAERTKQRTLAEWMSVLEPTRIPFAPIITYAEAMSSDHAAANSVFSVTALNGRDIQLAAVPVHVQADPDAPRHRQEIRNFTPPPAIGEHTAEVLREIGLADLADRAAGEGR